MKRLLHFVLDEKFTLDSIKCFENSKLVRNTFLYYKPKYKKCIEYLNGTPIKTVNYQEIMKFINSKESYDAIILHSLYAIPTDIITSIPTTYKLVWYAWGFDLYSNPYPIKALLTINHKYGKITKQLLYRIEAKENILKLFKHIVKLLLKKSYSPNNVYKAINRIDYFAGVFPEEFDMMKEKYACFKANKLIHNYIHPVEFLEKDIYEPVHITGSNILLGNSAAKIGNHLDIIDYMCRKGIKAEAIYCPLSYQVIPKYVTVVKSKGQKVFGNNFIPITDYLPFEQYTKIVNSCSCLILGQMQQAATCNILSAIWSGLKVFLPKDSMNYIHYKKEGLTVYSIEDDLSNESIRQPRIFEEVIVTRKIIESIYSYRRWVVDLNNFLTIIDYQ